MISKSRWGSRNDKSIETGEPMRDKWTEISSAAYDHSFMMPVPGWALIRHVEKSEDGDVAVSVCFVPNADGKTALQSSQFSNS
jgi:hypothetical protein